MDKDKIFEIKDSIKVEGITDDYVWWHKEKLLLQMKSWEFDFKRMCEVMEARHNEHLKMIEDLLREIKLLKKEKADE
jgi:hypothetical protein